MPDEPSTTGTLDFREWSTWYRVTGELPGERTPLVTLHGGPGASHDYLLSLTDLATGGRAVVHYDQLGCGRSTHLPDRGDDFWSVELFLDELDNLLERLGLAGGYHLLGQSWGGMLAAEHAVRRPAGLRSLVISNSPASMALWSEAADALRAQLPDEVREALERHEAAGTYDDPEYLAATEAYYDRHVCRVRPYPPEVQRSFDQIGEDPTVYHTMNGPNEFYCVGTLRSWSIVERAALIDVPTLLVSGRHDEATPLVVQPFFDAIPDVRWEVLDESSHMPFVEERSLYMELVGAFLAEHDR
ncbi:MAG TPA: proline iminopeptidase-family hydrolase [Acidimicrobiales bacterium]|nr:proline iminopeptidase-family hydrolase [Acidimicrobiales bacterium]